MRDAGIHAFEVVFIVIKGGFDHVKAEGGIRMFVKAAHDARHVDALLVCLKADRPSDRGFKLQIAVVAGVEFDR